MPWQIWMFGLRNAVDQEQKTETEHASGFHSRETLKLKRDLKPWGYGRSRVQIPFKYEFFQVFSQQSGCVDNCENVSST